MSGRTVSQGNPYQKLKSPRISATIFFERSTKQDLKIFSLILFRFRRPKVGVLTPPVFKSGGVATPPTPPVATPLETDSYGLNKRRYVRKWSFWYPAWRYNRTAHKKYATFQLEMHIIRCRISLLIFLGQQSTLHWNNLITTRISK